MKNYGSNYLCYIYLLMLFGIQFDQVLSTGTCNRCENYTETRLKEHYTETSLKTLCTILQLLRWESALVFFENISGEDMLQSILQWCQPFSGRIKVSQFDISQLTHSDLRTLLATQYVQTTDAIHAILFVGEMGLDILSIADTVDDDFKKTTNYRSNSQWIIVCDGKQYERSIVGIQLKHVLMMDCCGPCLYLHTLYNGTTLELTCPNQTLSLSECSPSDLFPNLQYKLSGRHLSIGTIVSKPFFEIHSDNQNQTSYTGIVVALTNILSEALNFSFTFVQPADQQWGVIENGEWNGLVRDLLHQKVDIVIADLTVTNERLEVIDFIFPAFLNQNLGIMYRKGTEQKKSDWLKVFNPLHAYVYGSTFGVLLIVACLLLCLDRTDNQYIYRKQTSAILAYLTNIMISLIGFLSLQGNGLQPRTSSAKVMLSFFWMFCVVITGTYIGNLTAKLTETRFTTPFDSVEELVESPGWTWGIGGPLTEQMIKLHSSESMKKLYRGALSLNKSDHRVLSYNNTYQFNRILNAEEQYAYIVLDAKHFVYSRKDCAFELAESIMSGLPLAIAVNKNSYLKRDLEQAMWGLFSNGLLQRLDEMHYMDNRPASCMIAEHQDTVLINDMLGLLWIVGVGLSVAVFVLILEFAHRKWFGIPCVW